MARAIYAHQMNENFGFSESELFGALFNEWTVNHGIYKFRGYEVRFAHKDGEGYLVVTDSWEDPVVLLTSGKVEVLLQSPEWFRAKARGSNQVKNSITITGKRYSAFQLGKIAAQAKEAPGLFRVLEVDGCQLTAAFVNDNKVVTRPLSAKLLAVRIEPADGWFYLQLPKSFFRWAINNADQIQLIDDIEYAGSYWFEFLADYEKKITDNWEARQRLSKKIDDMLNRMEKINKMDYRRYTNLQVQEDYTSAAIEAARLIFLSGGEEKSKKFIQDLVNFVEQEYDTLLFSN